MSPTAKSVVVRFPASNDVRRNWRRLLPASVTSVIFHGVLFAVMLMLSTSGQADNPVEQIALDTIIGTETQTYDPAKDDPFLASVRNDGSTEPYQDPANESAVKDKVTIPGMVDPLDNPGLNSGKIDGLLQDLGPQLGYSKASTGLTGALPGIDGNSSSTLPLGGIPTGGSNPDYFRIVRGSSTTREALWRKGGGTGESEAAVTRGLKWLIRNQSPDGSWRLDGNFADKGTQNDIAGTAFGLLPLLAAGKTHKPGKDNDPYDKPIERALLYLVKKQDKRTGNFGGGMYGHGLATIAVCEAYGMTQDPAYRRSAQLAVNFIVGAQHEAGGWRYAPNQAGDTSVSGWQIMALKSGLMAGLDVPERSMRKAMAFLNACCDTTNEGYGYVGIGSTPTMSAVGLLCRQYLESWGPQNVRLIKGIDKNLAPRQPGVKDIYYFYYATQVMYHFGGETWTNWNKKMRDFLVSTQEKDAQSPNFGSWSSAGDPQGSAGGRLMITSLNLLTLEVYYRHLPLYFREGMAKKGL